MPIKFNARKAIAAAVITGATLVTPVGIASARTPRVALTTSEYHGRIYVKPPQRLDMLVPATDLSKALDTCAGAGGTTPVRISRMPHTFGNIAKGTPIIRCYGIDY
jgi:hypothetical protein